MKNRSTAQELFFKQWSHLNIDFFKNKDRPGKKFLLITQVRCRWGKNKKQKATLKGLGLGKIGRTVILTATPETVGQVAKVNHLVGCVKVDPRTVQNLYSARPKKVKIASDVRFALNTSLRADRDIGSETKSDQDQLGNKSIEYKHYSEIARYSKSLLKILGAKDVDLQVAIDTLKELQSFLKKIPLNDRKIVPAPVKRELIKLLVSPSAEKLRNSAAELLASFSIADVDKANTNEVLQAVADIIKRHNITMMSALKVENENPITGKDITIKVVLSRKIESAYRGKPLVFSRESPAGNSNNNTYRLILRNQGLALTQGSEIYSVEFPAENNQMEFDIMIRSNQAGVQEISLDIFQRHHLLTRLKRTLNFQPQPENMVETA